MEVWCTNDVLCSTPQSIFTLIWTQDKMRKTNCWSSVYFGCLMMMIIYMNVWMYVSYVCTRKVADVHVQPPSLDNSNREYPTKITICMKCVLVAERWKKWKITPPTKNNLRNNQKRPKQVLQQIQTFLPTCGAPPPPFKQKNARTPTPLRPKRKMIPGIEKEK